MLGAEGEGALAALPGVAAALRRAAVDLEHAARRRHVVIVLRRQSAELAEGSVHAHVALSLPPRRRIRNVPPGRGSKIWRIAYVDTIDRKPSWDPARGRSRPAQ